MDRNLNHRICKLPKTKVLKAIWDSHVGIYHSGDRNSFTSFDQNWPVGSLCHYQPHNYTNVEGWLRPKKSPNENNSDDPYKQSLIDAGLITRPDKPYSDDELDYLMINNISSVEAGRSALTGDDYARKYWLEKWEIEDCKTAIDEAISETDLKWQSKVETANVKLAQCEVKKVENYSAWQLISMGWKKMWRG